MQDRDGAPGPPPLPRRRFVAAALAAVTAILVGCGQSTTSMPPGTGTPPPTVLVTPAPTTGAPTASASAAPGAALTFPPSQTAIEPGTYRWDGFERTISLELGPGWALGHDNPTFFDLFRGSDLPSITFARFSDVYIDATTRADAVDAASVASALEDRADLTITRASTIELGGLTGRQFDLATTQPQTPLFFGRAGDFKLDPEFSTRYRILDFPGGGILVIGIHTRTDGFDEGVLLGDPVVATLTIEP